LILIVGVDDEHPANTATANTIVIWLAKQRRSARLAATSERPDTRTGNRMAFGTHPTPAMT
jgi:hypothetical protein